MVRPASLRLRMSLADRWRGSFARSGEALSRPRGRTLRFLNLEVAAYFPREKFIEFAMA